MSPCLALWIGFCIYLAVLDRTPCAFLFQMASFSTAIISFPYFDDPSDIFTTTVSRVEQGGKVGGPIALDAQRAWVYREIAVAAAEAEVSNNQIAAFLALGGGWQ